MVDSRTLGVFQCEGEEAHLFSLSKKHPGKELKHRTVKVRGRILNIWKNLFGGRYLLSVKNVVDGKHKCRNSELRVAFAGLPEYVIGIREVSPPNPLPDWFVPACECLLDPKVS